MAKKSKIARNEQRKVIVERYAERRAELKKTLVDPNATDEAREAARVGLQKLPRNASPVRLRNRDSVDGRPAVTSRPTASAACVSATWPTVASCRASRSLPGRFQPVPQGPRLSGLDRTGMVNAVSRHTE